MSSVKIGEREFDLQPHPRILPILGEITLSQWQCLAELVDNSIDAFIKAEREGRPVAQPEVNIFLPTRASPDARITVVDNAIGMDADTLENAVRAGWTSNDPIGNLGLFGMGFNIATARLGLVTRVWSTRTGDTEWHGLEINFERLVRQHHYRTPLLTRPKADPQTQGTEISIERLKPEQAHWFARAANRSNVKRQLERVYSAMLRPGGVPVSLRLLVNGDLLKGRQHCIWGGPGNPERTVIHARFGAIRAYQTIDVRLPDRPFCLHCWYWLQSDETICPSCESGEHVVSRERRVRGWLGVQRYLDENDYGIDFVRHGRKIEIGNKDLFYWRDVGDKLEREYPIDDPRQRGRIVGEIHLDHCRVAYTKDRFERNDAAWEEMVRIVRGEGPLRPDKAAAQGYGPNHSPLYQLFQAFRRSSPKPKIAGAYKNLLIVPDNDRARDMAQSFYAGDAEYQTDKKWWELVEDADRALLMGDGPTGTNTSARGSESGAITGEEFFGGASQATTADDGGSKDEVAPPPRDALPSLTREYRDEVTEQRWDVHAYAVQATDPDLGGVEVPWRLRRTTAGTYEFLVNLRHGVFQSATMTPLDALLAELAWSATDFLHGQSTSATFATVLAALRDRYGGPMKLDPVELSAEANLTLRAVARGLARHVDASDAKALFEELSSADRMAILSRLATAQGMDATRAIADGRFLEYAPRHTLLRFFERHPELFLDGRYWDVAYDSLDFGDPQITEEARQHVVRRFVSLLADATWLADTDPNEIAELGREQLLRAALALELLASDTVSEEV